MATEFRIKLAYDADSNYYKKAHPLRIKLIKFLLANHAYDLKSYVGSTISFSFDWNSMPLDYWVGIILSELDTDFYYQISLVSPTNPPTEEFETRIKSKIDFEENFQTDLETARGQLLKEKK